MIRAFGTTTLATSTLFSRRFPVFGVMSTGGPVRRCAFVTRSYLEGDDP